MARELAYIKVYINKAKQTEYLKTAMTSLILGHILWDLGISVKKH